MLEKPIGMLYHSSPFSHSSSSPHTDLHLTFHFLSLNSLSEVKLFLGFAWILQKTQTFHSAVQNVDLVKAY